MIDPSFVPFDPQADKDIKQRNLPHWGQGSATYFVTYRTADSLPQRLLEEYQTEKERWLCDHPKPWTDRQWKAFNQRFSERMEGWSDKGYGACLLKQAAVQDAVEESLKYFDGKRYVLDEYVIMPNHIHVIVKPAPDVFLSKILHSWKSYTSHYIQKLGKAGARFWMDENFDHIIRSEEQLKHFRNYIEQNPVKAHLGSGSYRLGIGLGLK